MTAPDKPGLSNEEFIPFSRGMVGEAIHACPPNKEVVIVALAERLNECLDRLEALIRQGSGERDTQPELKHNDPNCGADILCGTHTSNCHCKCHASADKAQGGKGDGK